MLNFFSSRLLQSIKWNNFLSWYITSLFPREKSYWLFSFLWSTSYTTNSKIIVYMYVYHTMEYGLPSCFSMMRSGGLCSNILYTSMILPASSLLQASISVMSAITQILVNCFSSWWGSFTSTWGEGVHVKDYKISRRLFTLNGCF